MTISEIIKSKNWFTYVLSRLHCKEAEKYINSGENILYANMTKFKYSWEKKQLFGIVVVTSRKLILIAYSSNKKTENCVPIKTIKSVEREVKTMSFLYHSIIIKTLNEIITIYCPNKEDTLLLNALNKAIENYLISSKTECTTKKDYIDELEKLAALKDKGIITESEFLEKKKQLLSI